MKQFLIALFAMVVSGAWAQIYEPEGVNMPGAWNGWSNPPSNLALANGNQTSGGRLNKISSGTARWQTIFSAAASGGDVVGGFYEFKFSSGPSGSPWNNTWGEGTFSMNTLTNVNFQVGPNNNITLSNGKWYTMNFIDNSYASTQAIFMETSAQPVTFSSAVQSPANGSVENTDAVTVTVTASAQPSAEELVYVRYSTDAFASSSLAAVTFSGTTGTATIPAQASATTVQYYVFSTTVSNPSASNIDKVTIRTLTNSGANFNYTVNSPLPPVDITFQVDMNQVTIDPSGVFIAGSFNGFSNQAMTDAGGGIYTYTASLAQGASVQYKFKNGTNGWEGNISAPCGDGSNRTYTVGSSNATADLVCFNSCAACPSTYSVTFRVNMSAESVGGSVYINGNFPPANWSTPQLMTDEGGGVYSYTATLGAGNSYEYKYINGSTYEGNLPAPCGNGSNRTITVPSANTTLPVACFGYCGNCTTNAVTFRVDMSQQTVDPSGVFIAGSFNGFSNTALTSVGGGVYSVTLNLQQGTSVDYKFKNGTAGWEGNISAPCGNGSNRTLNVSGASSQLVAVTCFNSCGACPQFNDYTFSVNMANTVISANGVHLAGGFGAYGYANWSPSGIAMSDADGNGIYEVTLVLPAGQSFEYKFINGNDWPGAESVPAECNTFTNRVYTTAATDASVNGGAVCFGACGACAFGVSNDAPYTAVNLQFSGNTAYPNCYTINGTLASASDSPQSADFSGNDVWYKFIAQSTAVSITLNGSSHDDAIAIYEKVGSGFQLMSGSLENAASGNGDFERLNYSGLTPGNWYYVSIGSASGNGGAYTMCVQHLMPSTCATIMPAGGFNLCSTFKAAYRGSASQNVGYTFHFTPNGSTAGSASTFGPSSNLISLSNPTLGLRYGGTYTGSVDVAYGLTNGAGTPEPISVIGATTGGCSNIAIMSAPQSQVRLSQRCPSSLFRGTWLAGERVVSTQPICGAVNYTYSFRQVSSCLNGTAVALDSLVYTTNAGTPYMQLGVLPSFGNVGAWDVRIRPNFNGYSGNYGPAQRIQVAGTSASGELEYELVDAEKSMELGSSVLSVYPNPSNGEFVNISLTDLVKGQLQVRVLDAAGRLILTRVYSVEESLNTTINFDQQLSSGIYMMEMVNAGQMQTQRLVVE
jgi:hypothetical protein